MNAATTLRVARRWTFVAGGLGGVILCGHIAQAFLIGMVVDDVLQHRTPSLTFFAAFMALLVVRAALGGLARLTAHHAAARAKQDLREALYRKTLAQGPAALTKSRTGEIVNESVEGLETLDVYYGLYLPQFYVSLAAPVLLCGAMAWLDWKTGVLLLISAPLAPMLLGLVQGRFRSVTQRYYASANRLSAQFLDSLQGLPTLKMFNRGKSHGEAIRAESEALRRETMGLLALNQIVIFIMDWGFALGAITAAFVVSAWRWEAGALSLGGAVTVILLSVEFVRQLNLIGAFVFAGAMGRRMLARVKERLDQPEPRVAAPRTAAALPGTAPAIHLEQVTFAHAADLPPVLERVSVSLLPGELVVLTGPSGAGKSTLLQLLLRFLEPQRGTIRLDHAELNSIPRSILCEKIALVAQDPYLFHGSIADNLRVAKPDASLEEMVAVMKVVELHDFIRRLPQGYQTPVGERALSLSGGQRQRLALARALLQNTPILLLDEATAQVDRATALLVNETLVRLAGEKTVLLITHQPEMLRRADRVWHLEEGELTDITHGHALEKAA